MFWRYSETPKFQGAGRNTVRDGAADKAKSRKKTNLGS